MVSRWDDWSRLFQASSRSHRLLNRRRPSFVSNAAAYVQLLEERTLLAAVPVNPPTTASFQNGVNGYNGTTDASIRSNQQTTNTGNSSALQAHGNPDRATLIRWDISSIPTGVAVTSATISFSVANQTSQAYNLYAVLKPWNEGQVNWRRASSSVNWGTAGAQGSADRGSTVLGTVTANAGTVTLTLNSAGIAQVQAWVNNPSTNFGFIIQNYAASDDLELRSSETSTASQRPKLTINYTTDLTTVSFQNGADGYNGTIDTRILGDSRTLNDGNGTILQGDGRPDRGSLIKWDISSIETSAVVTSASITFNITNGSSQSYELYALLRPWIESQATWNQASAGNSWGSAGAQASTDRSPTVLASITATSTGLVTVQLNSAGIAMVQQWIDNPSSNNGFLLADYAPSDSLDISSSEASSLTQRPKLVITLANERRSKLETIAEGLLKYNAIFGELTVDEVPEFFAAANSPFLSWRVHILPFIGYGDLYKQFHLDEAWDSAHNLTLLNQMPEIFRSRGIAKGANLTGFRMFQGNGAFEYGAESRDALDGAQHTLLVFETMSQNADFWTKPEEIPFNPADPLATIAKPTDSFLVSTVSGEIKEIRPTVAPATFRAFATWDGSEVLSSSQYSNLYVNWDAADNADVSKAKLKELSLALFTYEDVYFQFPPGDHVPSDWFDPATGKLYLSWRVHILPYLGYTDLFNQFHLNEPWNSPHNIQLLDKMPEEFRSRGLAVGGTSSAFKLISGPGAYDVEYVPGSTDLEGPDFSDVRDGISSTIQLIELTSDKAVPWTQWNEIEYNAANPLAGIGPIPSDGLHVTLWNGAVRTLNPVATAANLGIFETWDGNEIFGPAEGTNVFLDWIQPDDAVRRAVKLAEVGLAMHIYHDVFGSFPVRTIAANWDQVTKQPYLSWRVHLLPYLGYTDLYNQFQLNEPWNSAHNLTLLDKMPEIFHTRGLPANSNLTGLLLFMGPEGYANRTSSTDANNWRGPRIADIDDGTANTIMAIELLSNRAIEWTRPDDIQFNVADPLGGVGTIPADGLLVVMFDGSIKTINPAVTATNFKTFVTPTGDEIFGPAETQNVFLDWQEPLFTRNPTIEGEQFKHSKNKLKQIGLAFHNFHDTFGYFPIAANPDFWNAAASTPTNGVPNLSWRVHILPYIEYGDLYAQFHLDEAWDSPHNIQLLDKMPEIFRSRGLPADSTKTGFQLFLGDGAYEYSPSSPGYRGPRIRDIDDALSYTVSVIETLPEDAVEWTRPDGDIMWNPADPLGSLTLPADYFLALMFDGSVRTFNPYLNAAAYAAFITLSGGEPVPYLQQD